MYEVRVGRRHSDPKFGLSVPTYPLGGPIPVPVLVTLLYIGVQRLIWLPIQTADWLYTPPHLGAHEVAGLAWQGVQRMLCVVTGLFVIWLAAGLLEPPLVRRWNLLRWAVTLGAAGLVVMMQLALIRVIPG